MEVRDPAFTRICLCFYQSGPHQEQNSQRKWEIYSKTGNRVVAELFPWNNYFFVIINVSLLIPQQLTALVILYSNAFFSNTVSLSVKAMSSEI